MPNLEVINRLYSQSMALRGTCSRLSQTEADRNWERMLRDMHDLHSKQAGELADAVSDETAPDRIVLVADATAGDDHPATETDSSLGRSDVIPPLLRDEMRLLEQYRQTASEFEPGSRFGSVLERHIVALETLTSRVVAIDPSVAVAARGI